MKTSKFALLVALAFALWFSACSDDDSSSGTDAGYVDTETLDEASSASADSLAEDSDVLASSDSDEVAGEDSSVSSSDSETASSTSELGEDADSSDSGASSSSEITEEASSSSAEESSSSEITISITIPVGDADSTQVIPAGETVYATIAVSASTQCQMLCFGQHVEQEEDERGVISESFSAATLTIDGEEYEVLYAAMIDLESPCAGNTYIMSASDEISCYITY